MSICVAFDGEQSLFIKLFDNSRIQVVVSENLKKNCEKYVWLNANVYPCSRLSYSRESTIPTLSGATKMKLSRTRTMWSR